MNIFYLDKNLEKCAKYHCDKHVVKSIKEVRNYDLEKINNYKLEGYNSIIIWEYDINNNFEEVKEKLRRFVSET